jgi:hypothetical protein
MTDQIDLHTVECIASPPVADWPITVAITGVDMDLHGGLTLSFDRPLPESWKFPFNPENSADNVQFTVGAVVQDRYAASFVQMWQGRTMGDRSLPPILAGYQDWWGDPRHLWGPMSDYVPRAGDRVGFFVAAGNGRLTTAVTSVAERSNVVAVTLPPFDRGSFRFDGAPIQPPEPTPLPILTGDPYMVKLNAIHTDVQTLLTGLRSYFR